MSQSQSKRRGWRPEAVTLLVTVLVLVGLVCSVSACRPRVASVSYDQPVLVIAHNGTYRPTVTARLSNNRTLDVTGASAGTAYTADNSDLVSVAGDGTITVASGATTGETAKVTATHAGLRAELQVTIKNTLEATITVDDRGLPAPTNYNLLDVVVNKHRNLPPTYVPAGLTVPNVRFSFSGQADKKYLRAEAAGALEGLFTAAEAAGHHLAAVSGYRSYATQKSIFDRNVALYGLEAASRFSAYPGQSEHQTGLAMDVSSATVGFRLVEQFGDTPEGKWLAAHAADYGFVIRYPQGSEPITGYSYEPWHLRYVGRAIAAAVTAQGVTLEEYFAGPPSP